MVMETLFSQLPSACASSRIEDKAHTSLAAMMKSLAAQLQLPVQDDRSSVGYVNDPGRKLSGRTVYSGDVWFDMGVRNEMNFQRCVLTLLEDGFKLTPHNQERLRWKELSCGLCPLATAQDCVLRSFHPEADEVAAAGMRFFRLSVHSQNTTYLFAVEGDDSLAQRDRWLEAIVGVLHNIARSLFCPFEYNSVPVAEKPWTQTRLLAGYMLLVAGVAIVRVYCELHSHWDGQAAFVIYEDEECDAVLKTISIREPTIVRERTGLSCASFSIDGHAFCARSPGEKAFWLRAINNLKVKIIHRVGNPTVPVLDAYRDGVREGLRSLAHLLPMQLQQPGPILPRCHRPWQTTGGCDEYKSERPEAEPLIRTGTAFSRGLDVMPSPGIFDQEDVPGDFFFPGGGPQYMAGMPVLDSDDEYYDEAVDLKSDGTSLSISKPRPSYPPSCCSTATGAPDTPSRWRELSFDRVEGTSNSSPEEALREASWARGQSPTIYDDCHLEEDTYSWATGSACGIAGAPLKHSKQEETSSGNSFPAVRTISGGPGADEAHGAPLDAGTGAHATLPAGIAHHGGYLCRLDQRFVDAGTGALP
eukprot:TRINITY_DN40784_c0_g1_i1.p1 TRINITY_DN40784_c0_g1~~TRINITY_DN40784_c0_g1_i1.p1  ORF type:complete len:587 (-),score=106.44 TRINITY_DN40784_c0_g1_i1:161-1921(-)